MATSSAVTTIPNVSHTTCPLVVGYLLSCGLHGVLCVQVYYYYMAFPKDRIISKCVVFSLFILETIQLIFISHNAILVFGTGYGNVDTLIGVHLQWISVPIMAGLTSGTVQISFAYRIYLFSGSKIAGFIITLVALLQMISSFVVGEKLYHIEKLIKADKGTESAITIWLVGSAACDIIITAFLTYFLSRQQTTFKATQRLVSKVTRLTIENGFLTAAAAILSAALFLLVQGTNYHITPTLILGKLYSITLITTFNSRIRIVNGREEVPTNVIDTIQFRVSGMDSDEIRPGRALGVETGRSSGPATTVDIQRGFWENGSQVDQSKSDEELGVGDAKRFPPSAQHA